MNQNNIYKQILENNAKTFFLFAGPCVIESEENVFEIAEAMCRITTELEIPYVFKASFDKANRTALNSFRGPGLEKGLKILEQVKAKYKVPIITDVHTPEQVKQVARVADIIQIPAFLCRQTDLIVEVAKTGLPMNIKKAQFLSPLDMKNVVNKVISCGNSDIFLCERGTSFGYQNLVVDMTGIIEMKKIGFPIVFDATHSVQKPGANGDSTGGNREYAFQLAKAAAVVGADGFFMEVHPNPEQALSDGPNSISLSEIKDMLIGLQKIYSVNKNL